MKKRIEKRIVEVSKRNNLYFDNTDFEYFYNKFHKPGLNEVLFFYFLYDMTVNK